LKISVVWIGTSLYSIMSNNKTIKKKIVTKRNQKRINNYKKT